jgi:cell division transport system permease protein
MGSFMTILVIGIALSLPTGLHVVVSNVQMMGTNVSEPLQVSLFLKQDVDENDATALAADIIKRSDVTNVVLLHKSEALHELESLIGTDNIQAALGENPLPHILLITPMNTADAAAVEELGQELAKLPDVSEVELDMQWVNRLMALLDLLRDGTSILAVFLAIAVIMVVGNTIRLMSQNYRGELEVSKLVGATDQYVRRPFLYTGIIFGFLGSLMAYLVVHSILLWIAGPAAELAALYQSNYTPVGLNVAEFLLLVSGGILLGVIGSLIAVQRFIQQLEY